MTVKITKKQIEKAVKFMQDIGKEKTICPECGKLCYIMNSYPDDATCTTCGYTTTFETWKARTK